MGTGADAIPDGAADLAVDEASEQERPALASLLQLYLYDFTDFVPWDVGEDGRFRERALAGCWADPRRHL